MADEVKAAPAPAGPVVVATPAPVVQAQNAQRDATVGKQGDPAVAETKSAQATKSSRLITNPVAAVDPDAPHVEPKVDESTLPASTRAEMAAGRAALGKK